VPCLEAPPAPTAVVVPHVFVPKEIGSFALQKTTSFRCAKCGLQELPKLTYMDEMPAGRLREDLH